MPHVRAFVVVALWFVLSSRAVADESAGAAIYQKRCADCHGKAGEGTKAYSHPLIGNRSLDQLTRYVARKMPEDKPGSLSAVEAERISSYIFDAFYSPAAQARVKPPRLELARLTVNEYRNAVAELVGSVRPAKPAARDAVGPGLRGEYFNRDAKRNRTLAIARVDPVVDFDFNAAGFEKFDAPEIAAEWQGSVLAPETGLYDFVVRTEHSTRLWVNDMKKPVIDRAVKSGNETEFVGSAFLLAGRWYPVRLEFSRGSLGVRKDPKAKAAPPKTTLALAWKPPRREVEIVPRESLRPADAATSFAVSVALPPDDRSAGYERGAAVSKAWVQAAADGAIEAANYVVENLNQLAGTKADDPDRGKRLRDFAAAFVRRAFRRPLSAEDTTLFVDRPFAASKDDETAIKRVVLLAMQSPRFLYRESPTGNDPYAVASRIAFGLWDSPREAALDAAAAEGRLKTRDDVVREATRMLDDSRARAKIRGILLSWLKLDQPAETMKDPKAFPEFHPHVAGDLRASFERFLDDVVWSERSDFRRLLLDDRLHVNGRLAAVYGIDLPADAPLQPVAAKAGERFGVLTHPHLLANYSYAATSSPIHRGVFLARNVLGVNLRQPPDAFAPIPAELHPKLNTRERIALQTQGKECQSCHGVINPLGFTLEHFDAIGRFRDRENDKPIDSTGQFTTRSGDNVAFSGAGDLAKFLAQSEEVHEAFAARMFHSLVRQPILAYGPTKLDDVRRRFAQSDFHIRRLIVDILANLRSP